MGHMGQSSVNGKHNHTSYPSRFHLRTSQASRLRPATVERLWRGEFSGGILRVFWGEITKKPCWLITYNLKHYGFLGYISYIELVHEVYKPRNVASHVFGPHCLDPSGESTGRIISRDSRVNIQQLEVTQQKKKRVWLVVDLPLWKNMTSSVGMMTFPTEWKVIIHSCSKPPTSFHVKWRHVRMFAYVLQQAQSELSWCHVNFSVHFLIPAPTRVT